MDILDSPSIPIPNGKKIKDLALWVISRGNLPTALVATRSIDLKMAMNESIVYGRDFLSVCDGLKVSR